MLMCEYLTSRGEGRYSGMQKLVYLAISLQTVLDNCAQKVRSVFLHFWVFYKCA